MSAEDEKKSEHGGEKEQSSTTSVPHIAPLTLEDRGWLLGRLTSLRDRGSREHITWIGELQVVLQSVPLLQPISKMLDDARARSDVSDFQVSQLVDAALRVVEASTPAVGDGVRTLIAHEVQSALWQSHTIKVARWFVLPILLAALVGGTVLGTVKVDGIYRLAEDAHKSIAQSIENVHIEGGKAQNAVKQARDDAQMEIDKKVRTEAEKRGAALAELFASAERDMKTKLIDFDRKLAALKDDYTIQSDQHFRDHKSATDNLWRTQEGNWNSALNDRKDGVLEHFQTIQSNVDKKSETFNNDLNTVLQSAKRKVPDLEESIGRSQMRLEKISEQITAGDERVADLLAKQAEKLKGFLDAVEAKEQRLRDLISAQDMKIKGFLDAIQPVTEVVNKMQSANGSNGVAWFIRVVQVKDILATVAIILSIVSLLPMAWRAGRST